MNQSVPRIFLLSGPVNSGKTKAASALAHALRFKGIRIGGIVSHGIWDNGEKVGYEIEDLSSGARQGLAVIGRKSKIRQGRYSFLEGGLRFAEKTLWKTTDMPVVFIDEAGPLELRGEGLHTSLRHVLDNATGAIVLVVRTGLEKQVVSKYGLTSHRCIDPSPAGLELAAGAIAASVAVTGVILAGGRSSRMGEDKALMLWKGKPLLQHAAERLGRSFNNLLVVADREKEYEFLGLPVVRDIYKNSGPLAGIHSALIYARFHPCFVVATDLPGLGDGLITYLLQQRTDANAIVPSFQDRVHPLCGIYTHALLPRMEAHLKESRLNIHQFLADVGAKIVPVDHLSFCTSKTFVNINTREDYQHLKSSPAPGSPLQR